MNKHIVFACMASLLAACGGEAASGGPSVGALDDAGTVPHADGGSTKPTAVRKLVTVPLFESGAPDNRVTDPMLELRQWFFSDPRTGAASVHVNRVAFAQSPAGQAAIFVPGASQNPHGVTFGVSFKLPSTTYVASMWIGAKEKNITGVFPAVITSDDDGTGMPGYFELTADTAQTDVAAAGLYWTRFTVNADAPKVAGWGYLYGGTDGTQDLWVGGLEVFSGTGPSHMHPHRAAPESAVRFLTHARSHHPAPPRPTAR